jgi:hypothetical protein
MLLQQIWKHWLYKFFLWALGRLRQVSDAAVRFAIRFLLNDRASVHRDVMSGLHGATSRGTSCMADSVRMMASTDTRIHTSLCLTVCVMQRYEVAVISSTS